MSVLSFAAEDLFTLRVVKSLTTNPDNQWANSYEFQSVAGGSENELLALGEAVVLFEANFHRTSVNFDRLLISTWGPDSKPYNPDSFISTSLSAQGLVAFTTDQMALHTCLSVTRQAPSGRFGHIYYRGNLAEGDVSAPAGKNILVNRLQKQTDLDTALGVGGLDEYIGSAATGPFKMVLVNAAGTQVRTVIQLRAQGVAGVPTDHAWFNRTAPTP